jgi:hypothetical protein
MAAISQSLRNVVKVALAKAQAAKELLGILDQAGGVTAGTTLASSSLVVGAAKEVDTLAVASLVTGATTTPGSVTQAIKRIFKKTAIADNTATSIITVTVPNGNHSAAVRMTLLAALGTGTDTFESSRVADGSVVIARQTGANVVAAAATLTLAQIATVSGGGTLTLAYGVSSVTGAVGATNTFDIQVTLVKTGTITDLQCVIVAELVNAEASGVTMAQAA